MKYLLNGPLKSGPFKPFRPCRPPCVKIGQRKANPYSRDDLDSLFATVRAFPLKSLCTLKPPSSNRITAWHKLHHLLKASKKKLTNLHRRNGFPSCILVVEFIEELVDGVITPSAHFHIGFERPLTRHEELLLREWWLDQMALPNNKSRSFDYRTSGGGVQLQDYLAKDISKRENNREWVKYHAEWIPEHTDIRLWFVIGRGRHKPASEGRRIWSEDPRKGRRSAYDGDHGFRDLRANKSKDKALEVSPGLEAEGSESEQGMLSITHDASKPVPLPHAVQDWTNPVLHGNDGHLTNGATLADLWEVSGYRLERETLSDFSEMLPPTCWKSRYPMTREAIAVSQAMELHGKQALLATYRTGSFVTLLSTIPGTGREPITAEELIADLGAAVYYVGGPTLAMTSMQLKGN